jgi:hypothetical protein
MLNSSFIRVFKSPVNSYPYALLHFLIIFCHPCFLSLTIMFRFLQSEYTVVKVESDDEVKSQGVSSRTMISELNQSLTRNFGLWLTIAFLSLLSLTLFFRQSPYHCRKHSTFENGWVTDFGTFLHSST